MATFERYLSLMLSASSVLAHSQKVVVRKINNENLLVPLTDNIADMDAIYRLNETATFIWEAIDGKRNIRDITLMLTKEFNVDPDEAEKDILSFITEIKDFLVFQNHEY